MKKKKKKTSGLWFINEVIGYKKIYILALLFVQIFLSVSSIFYAFILRNVIDAAIEHNKSNMLQGIMIFIILVIGQIVLRSLVRFLEELSKSTYENIFKQRLFLEIMRRDYGKIMTVHSGEWMNRLTSDTVVIADGLTTIIPGVIGMITKMLGAFIMVFIIEPRLGFIMIPGGIILVFLTYIFRKRLKKLHKNVQEKDGLVRIFMQECISSLAVVEVFGKENSSLSMAKMKMNEHKNARMEKNFFSNICNIGFSAAMNGAYILGLVYGAFGIYNGFISYGTLMAILQLIGQIQNPFANITGYLPKYYAMIASAERLMEVESYSLSMSENIRSKEEAKVIYESELKRIIFKNVTFAYNRNKEYQVVLKNVFISIEKGDYVAITGISGCGKSTILKLLMGLYVPSNGNVEVFLEGNQRIPIYKLRRLFAYVPQGNYLMSGSIKNVITFGEEREDNIRKCVMKNVNIKDNCDSVEEISVTQAISIACGEFIYDLPDGLNTVLGERGFGLSEGQMQRIAIARALYSNAPILILDEATSALDIETEERLLKNLKSLTNKTVFIVTHRPKAISICNRLLEFNEKKEVVIK